MLSKKDEISVRLLPLGDLIPNERNARTHPEEQVEQIAESIRKFGFTNPILADVDGGNIIVAGHGRRLAALSIIAAGDPIRLPSGRVLPAGQVPVIDCSGWSEAERRAYTIADNRLAETSEWDEDLLRLELVFLQEQEFDLGLTGFDSKSLSRILDFGGTEGETDPDEVPGVEAVAVSRPGDIWVLGNHRIICGDSTDSTVVEAPLDGERPHLMVTDPPYGVEYDPSWRAKAGVNKNKGKMGKVLNDDRADWREAWELFPGDVAYVWHASMFTREVLNSLEACSLHHRSMIIWVKDRFTLGRGDYHWQHEPCWYVVREGKAGHYAGGRSQSTTWNIPARDDSGVGHGTQKPVECMKRPIENNSEPGDAVYEPFSGSGTTIIAAEMTGRRCFAIELNPAYVDVAVRRWQAFTGQSAHLVDGGQDFDDVAADRAP